MLAKALLCSIAACLTSACAQMPGVLPASPPPGAKTCGGSSCDVKVSVKCDDLVNLICWIESDSDYLIVPKNNSPVITWEIVTSGYTFSDNGIAFPSGSPFTCHPAGKTKFICNDRHTEPGKYKYTITLIGFPLVFPKDPWVDNQ